MSPPQLVLTDLDLDQDTTAQILADLFPHRLCALDERWIAKLRSDMGEDVEVECGVGGARSVLREDCADDGFYGDTLDFDRA